MTKTIWEFELGITDTQTITMPDSSPILSVQAQGHRLTMWALVLAHAAPQERTFEIFGAGHPVPVGPPIRRRHIGTVQMPDSLVWHVFERIDLADPKLLEDPKLTG